MKMIKSSIRELNTKKEFDDYALRIAHLQLLCDELPDAYPKELTKISISAMKFFFNTWKTVYNLSATKETEITDSYEEIYKTIRKSDEA